MPNLQHQLLSTTNPGKLVYQLGTDSAGINHYRHHTKDSSTTLTLQTNRTERHNFTSGSRPTDLSYLSLTANNITAKLTIRLTTTIHLNLRMTSTQVVKISVTTTDNSPSQDYTHPDDQTTLLQYKQHTNSFSFDFLVNELIYFVRHSWSKICRLH